MAKSVEIALGRLKFQVYVETRKTTYKGWLILVYDISKYISMSDNVWMLQLSTIYCIRDLHTEIFGAHH